MTSYNSFKLYNFIILIKYKYKQLKNKIVVNWYFFWVPPSSPYHNSLQNVFNACFSKCFLVQEFNDVRRKYLKYLNKKLDFQ